MSSFKIVTLPRIGVIIGVTHNCRSSKKAVDLLLSQSSFSSSNLELTHEKAFFIRHNKLIYSEFWEPLSKSNVRLIDCSDNDLIRGTKTTLMEFLVQKRLFFKYRPVIENDLFMFDSIFFNKYFEERDKIMAKQIARSENSLTVVGLNHLEGIVMQLRRMKEENAGFSWS